MTKRFFALLTSLGAPPQMVLRLLAPTMPGFEAVAVAFEKEVSLRAAFAAAPELFDPVWVATLGKGEDDQAVDTRLRDLIRYERAIALAGSGSFTRASNRLVAAAWVLLRAGLGAPDVVETAVQTVGTPAQAAAARRKLMNGSPFADALAESGLLDTMIVDALRLMSVAGEFPSLEIAVLDWVLEEVVFAATCDA